MPEEGISMDKRAIKSRINIFNDSPGVFERRKYSENEKKMLIEYMGSGELCGVVGYVDDCVEGKQLDMDNGAYRDEGFVWTTSDMYHIEHYDAAVTDEFISHVMSATR